MCPRSHQEGSGRLETRGFCSATGMALTGTAQLFNHRLLAGALFTEAEMGLVQTALNAAERGLSKCYDHTATFFTYCLTSFFAFLRRLGLLGEAGVQPRCRLAVVAEA